MSALIVDPEPACQTALFQMLKKSGSPRIFQARNAEEAKRMISAHRNSLRLILIDQMVLEVSHEELIDTINNFPELDSCGIVLMSSAGTPVYVRQFVAQLPRIDHYIKKPFRRTKLMRVLRQALINRQTERSTLLIWSKEVDHPLLRAIYNDDALAMSAQVHWNHAFVVTTRGQFEQQLKEHQSNLGAILVDPAALADGLDERVFGKFCRSHLGSLTVRASLSTSPRIPASLRRHCHLFCDVETTSGREGCLSVSSRRALYLPSLHFIMNNARNQIREGRLKQARLTTLIALRLDPWFADGHALLAEIDLKRGAFADAISHSRKAVGLNPFLPHPYLVYLRARELARFPADADWIRQAQAYCPRHPEIMAVAGPC